MKSIRTSNEQAAKFLRETTIVALLIEAKSSLSLSLNWNGGDENRANGNNGVEEKGRWSIRFIAKGNCILFVTACVGLKS